MTSGEPSGLLALRCDTWPMVRSCTLLHTPTVMRFTSPRSTALHHTELSRPSVTSPMTWAESWMKTPVSRTGAVSRYGARGILVSGCVERTSERSANRSSRRFADQGGGVGQRAGARRGAGFAEVATGAAAALPVLPAWDFFTGAMAGWGQNANALTMPCCCCAG